MMDSEKERGGVGIASLSVELRSSKLSFLLIFSKEELFIRCVNGIVCVLLKTKQQLR